MKKIIVTSLLSIGLLTTNSFADNLINDRLINAIAQVESNCTDNAIGDDGKSFGICQISLSVLKEWNDNTRVEFSKGNLLDPQINKRLCEWYLNRLITRYHCANLEQVLVSYNWGIGNLRKVNYDVSRAPKSTKEYVKKVMSLMKGM